MQICFHEDKPWFAHKQQVFSHARTTLILLSISLFAAFSANGFREGCRARPPRLHSGLTCLQEHLSPVQVFHLVAVVLGVRRAGTGGPRLGPVHFGEPLGVKLQGVHPAFPGQVQDHPAGHHVPVAEHRRTVQLRGVEDDVELFQLVENHCRGRGESSSFVTLILLVCCRYSAALFSLTKSCGHLLQLCCRTPSDATLMWRLKGGGACEFIM